MMSPLPPPAVIPLSRLSAELRPIAVVPWIAGAAFPSKRLEFASRISNEIIAIHVEPENHSELLREDWERYVEKPFREAGAELPQLTILPSPYRLVIVPIVQYVLQLSEKYPDSGASWL